MCHVVVKIKLCQRHSFAVLSVPSNSCRSLSIFSPHIGPRGSWDGRVEAGVDYWWILHRSAGPLRVNDRQLHQRPATTRNDQQRPATIINDPANPTPPVNSP
ncbi:hypothetical protein N7450_011427 [Penicillium hetheringtonii]|uniref:Uncharacterized protein n=1 Tax=Penicillium hetheringtonii TaxID=911720 RepID=A0AAD6GKZ7_9EURO|nr:hypothetical protein N7450_011427 [Penicillium hetheringtonii]